MKLNVDILPGICLISHFRVAVSTNLLQVSHQDVQSNFDASFLLSPYFSGMPLVLLCRKTTPTIVTQAMPPGG
jgi:hypothetical protein